MESITKKMVGVFTCMLLLLGAASVKADTVNEVWIADWFAYIAWTDNAGGTNQCFESVGPGGGGLKADAPGTLAMYALMADARKAGTPVGIMECVNGNNLRINQVTSY